jgi:uncharacterized protein YnzC (UPF0291/DUF896 family)
VAWQKEHSTESEASPEAVWELYTDVDNWSDWSRRGVEHSTLDGDFKEGTKGVSKAPHLPKGKFELVEVEPERRFTAKSGLPGARLLFEHEIEPAGEGTRITHRATLDGPLAVVWTPVVSWIVERGMADSVERLSELAVQKQKDQAWESEEQRQHRVRLEQADMQFKEEIEKTAHGDDAGAPSLPGSG